MPKIDVKDMQSRKVGSVELPDEVFGYPYKEHLIHEAVRNHLASLRAGTHKTKVRSEVAGSGRKPFRQKGTGRARQGGNRPPIHRHGGTAFGPVPRDYSYKMNVREKKAALKSALSFKMKHGKILALRALDLDEPKTRILVERLASFGVEGKTLIVDSLDNVNVVLASRNHPEWRMVDPLHMNVYDVVDSRFILISEAALQTLTEVLS
ncbi:MAG TPA: 50S ribosomal protein L4 [Thermoanaerobaculia bacterium]|nr:50S ribosomal protein L4 [Thermoanaerobaculia bacterium]